MGKEAFSKIKLLKIWEILKQDSDENNPLTTKTWRERNCLRPQNFVSGYCRS